MYSSGYSHWQMSSYTRQQRTYRKQQRLGKNTPTVPKYRFFCVIKTNHGQSDVYLTNRTAEKQCQLMYAAVKTKIISHTLGFTKSEFWRTNNARKQSNWNVGKSLLIIMDVVAKVPKNSVSSYCIEVRYLVPLTVGWDPQRCQRLTCWSWSILSAAHEAWDYTGKHHALPLNHML